MVTHRIFAASGLFAFVACTGGPGELPNERGANDPVVGSESTSGRTGTGSPTGTGTSIGTSAGGETDPGAPSPTPTPDCSYAEPTTPQGCPSFFDRSKCNTQCPTEGLKCWYPGVGDSQPDGCLATALLSCSGVGDSDAGALEWRCAQ